MDLATTWAGLLALAVFLYVALDGFDLGVGLLFPFAKDRKERDQMMASIAPVWDGNETWLVLGGGGLLATFPKAYAVLMPALYVPIIVMLVGLIFRGVAFEFRLNARGRGQKWWTASFVAGSLAASVGQGLVLGGFLQGVRVENRAFAGGAYDWATPFSFLVATGLCLGYALLGAGWLQFKVEGPLHQRVQQWTRRLAVLTGGGLGAVSFATLFVDPRVTARWGFADHRLDPQDLLLALLPLTAGALLLWLSLSASRREEGPWVYLAGLGVFACGFLGLAVSMWPYIAPFALTPREAAAPDNALAFMLAGAAVLLPLILAYTAYSYWVFRAKVGPDASYH